jgi:hypothetical protein
VDELPGAVLVLDDLPRAVAGAEAGH